MNGYDRIRHSFLTTSQEEALALASESDLIEVYPLDGPPASTYILRFRCTGLILRRAGQVEEWDHWEVGVQFSHEYLRDIEPYRVLTWLGPREVHHPNISIHAPILCIGDIYPSTSLVDLIYRTWEVITYRRYVTCEDDCLNPAAAQWARGHTSRFPVDPRALKLNRPSGRIQAIADERGLAS